EQGHYRYKVTATGDEAEVNATLSERLARDFNMRLPDFGEEARPEAYFESVTRLVAEKRRWRVRRFGTVGLFAFSRLAMWQDLDPSRWPDSLALDRHPLLLDLLAGRAGETGGTVGYGDVYDVDDPAVAA